MTFSELSSRCPLARTAWGHFPLLQKEQQSFPQSSVTKSNNPPKIMTKLYKCRRFWLTCPWATLPHGCKDSRTSGWAPGLCRTLGRPQGTSTQTPSSASAGALWGCWSLGMAPSWRRWSPRPLWSSAQVCTKERHYKRVNERLFLVYLTFTLQCFN